MTSVFESHRDQMFDRIHLKLRFTDRLVGGCPKDPKLVEAWLGTKMGIAGDDVELLMLTRQHLIEMGVEIPEHATREQIYKAIESVADDLKTQGFKRDGDGNAYIEERQIKAGIKESVNILFAGEKWGKLTAAEKGDPSYGGKGVRAFTAERVYIKPDRIIVGTEADVAVEFFVGHLNGPTGPRSTIGYAECVLHPEISFDLLQLREQKRGGKGEPALDDEKWAKVWTHLELNGLGAMRSQGNGQFEVVEFSRNGKPAV